METVCVIFMIVKLPGCDQTYLHLYHHKKKNMRFLFICLVVATSSVSVHAQTMKELFGKKGKDSSKTSNVLKNILNQTKNGTLSTTEVIDGLKQALEIGAEKSGSKLSAVDGFFANAAIKILLPPEAASVEKTMRSLGMGKMVDDAILSINRAAEDAAKSAAPIFITAIKKMTFDDAWSILRGADTAATVYLRSKTTDSLTAAFKPVIEKSLQKVNATKYWNTVFTNYNRLAAKKVNPDLSAYATEKALAGIFYQLGEEEKTIRKNPAAQTTDLLKKVFGK
jgi:hypothetical protein